MQPAVASLEIQLQTLHVNGCIHLFPIGQDRVSAHHKNDRLLVARCTATNLAYHVYALAKYLHRLKKSRVRTSLPLVWRPGRGEARLTSTREKQSSIMGLRTERCVWDCNEEGFGDTEEATW